MGALIGNVLVEDEAGNVVLVKAGEEVSEHAAKQIGAHLFEDGKHPLAEGESSRRSRSSSSK